MCDICILDVWHLIIVKIFVQNFVRNLATLSFCVFVKRWNDGRVKARLAINGALSLTKAGHSNKKCTSSSTCWLLQSLQHLSALIKSFPRPFSTSRGRTPSLNFENYDLASLLGILDRWLERHKTSFVVLKSCNLLSLWIF